jgi:ABC-type branched-subunit amino acid transport system ATPase component
LAGPKPPASSRGLAPHQIARLGILAVPEGRKIFPGLTLEENLLTAVAARGGLRPATCGLWLV